MILIDANVWMYAAGKAHPLRAASVALLERVARREVQALVDAEVLQEILHRYRASGRPDDGIRVYDLVRTIVPDIVPIDGDVMDTVRSLIVKYPRLSTRDAVHAAAALDVAAEALCTWDTDFSGISEIRVVTPESAVG